MKKMVIGGISICCLGIFGGMWMFSRYQPTGSISYGTYSDRASQFQSQKHTMVDKPSLNGSRPLVEAEKNFFVQTSCFTFVLPYQSRHHQIDDTNGACRFQATIVSPPAYFTVGMYPGTGLDNDPSIIIRQRQQDIYKKEQIVLEGWLDAQLYRESNAATLFVYDGHMTFTFAFTNLLSSDQISVAQFRELVSTFNRTQSTPTP